MFHDFRELFRYLFVHWFLKTRGIVVGSMLAHCLHTLAFVSHLFQNVFAPVPQRVFLRVPFSCWLHWGSVLISVWLPVGAHVAAFWFPLVSFFLTFAARHGIVMRFLSMYLDFCCAMFMFIARWRDRGFAAQSIETLYIYIYIYIYMQLRNKYINKYVLK